MFENGFSRSGHISAIFCYYLPKKYSLYIVQRMIFVQSEIFLCWHIFFKRLFVIVQMKICCSMLCLRGKLFYVSY